MLQYGLMSRTEKRIQTLWFDLGNVILNFDFGPAYRKLGRYTPLKTDAIRRYFHSHPDLEAHLDEGRINASALYDKIRRELKVSGLPFAEFRTIWNEIFWENKTVASLVRRLRSRG